MASDDYVSRVMIHLDADVVPYEMRDDDLDKTLFEFKTRVFGEKGGKIRLVEKQNEAFYGGEKNKFASPPTWTRTINPAFDKNITMREIQNLREPLVLDSGEKKNDENPNVVHLHFYTIRNIESFPTEVLEKMAGNNNTSMYDILGRSNLRKTSKTMRDKIRFDEADRKLVDAFAKCESLIVRSTTEFTSQGNRGRAELGEFGYLPRLMDILRHGHRKYLQLTKEFSDAYAVVTKLMDEIDQVYPFSENLETLGYSSDDFDQSWIEPVLAASAEYDGPDDVSLMPEQLCNLLRDSGTEVLYMLIKYDRLYDTYLLMKESRRQGRFDKTSYYKNLGNDDWRSSSERMMDPEDTIRLTGDDVSYYYSILTSDRDNPYKKNDVKRIEEAVESEKDVKNFDIYDLRTLRKFMDQFHNFCTVLKTHSPFDKSLKVVPEAFSNDDFEHVFQLLWKIDKGLRDQVFSYPKRNLGEDVNTIPLKVAILIKDLFDYYRRIFDVYEKVRLSAPYSVGGGAASGFVHIRL